MRVLLMLPLRRADFFYVPDLGLGYLAAALRSRLGGKVSIELMVANLNLTDEAFRKRLIDGRYDLVGIKVFATSVGSANRTIGLIRQALPRATVVVGGPQATGDPDNILTYVTADYAFEGEAEEGFPILVEELLRGKLNTTMASRIPGLIWKEAQAVRRNSRAVVNQLDSLSWPAWDLMDPRNFSRQYQRFAKYFPVASVMTTRGCPFSCTFCSVSNTRLRMRSAESVVAELCMLYHTYGIREFNVLDSNCAHNKEHIVSFCRALVESGINIPWRVPGGIRLASLDDEVLHWLRKSGCYQIWVGIESGSDRILKQIKKSLTVGEITRKVELISRFDIDLGGFFIVGFPGETKEDIAATITLAKRLPLKYAVFTIFTPEPGSELFSMLERTGMLGGVAFDALDGRKFSNAFSEYGAGELSRLRDRITLSFHLRPRILLQILKDFSSPDRLLLLMRIASHFIRHRNSW